MAIEDAGNIQIKVSRESIQGTALVAQKWVQMLASDNSQSPLPKNSYTGTDLHLPVDN